MIRNVRAVPIDREQLPTRNIVTHDSFVSSEPIPPTAPVSTQHHEPRRPHPLCRRCRRTHQLRSPSFPSPAISNSARCEVCRFRLHQRPSSPTGLHYRESQDFFEIPGSRFASITELEDDRPTWELREDENPASFAGRLLVEQSLDLNNFGWISNRQYSREARQDCQPYYTPQGTHRIGDIFGNTIRSRRILNLEAVNVVTEQPRGLLSPEYARRRGRAQFNSSPIRRQYRVTPDLAGEGESEELSVCRTASPVYFDPHRRLSRSPPIRVASSSSTQIQGQTTRNLARESSINSSELLHLQQQVGSESIARAQAPEAVAQVSEAGTIEVPPGVQQQVRSAEPTRVLSQYFDEVVASLRRLAFRLRGNPERLDDLLHQVHVIARELSGNRRHVPVAAFLELEILSEHLRQSSETRPEVVEDLLDVANRLERIFATTRSESPIEIPHAETVKTLLQPEIAGRVLEPEISAQPIDLKSSTNSTISAAAVPEGQRDTLFEAIPFLRILETPRAHPLSQSEGIPEIQSKSSSPVQTQDATEVQAPPQPKRSGRRRQDSWKKAETRANLLLEKEARQKTTTPVQGQHDKRRRTSTKETPRESRSQQQNSNNTNRNKTPPSSKSTEALPKTGTRNRGEDTTQATTLRKHKSCTQNPPPKPSKARKSRSFLLS